MSKIYVSTPYLPPLDELVPYMQDIWDSRMLTNNGKFHRQLERELAGFLGVSCVSLFANGTLALIAALKCLAIKGEVITTPFSFAATANAIVQAGLKPVFADVDSYYGNLDPKKIEKAITPDTAAIMPVHVYGHPCDVEGIDAIAKKYSLKVIYDAAHAFGARYKGRSLLSFGDISAVSFHATKSFNTFEGGALICRSPEIKRRIDSYKAFGIQDDGDIYQAGTNAKLNEFQAALGLLQLKHFDRILNERRALTMLYHQHLDGIEGISCISQKEEEAYNYAYFPIFVDEKVFGTGRKGLAALLFAQDIVAREYFYPLISDFDFYKKLYPHNENGFPAARSLSEKVLCLPLYPGLAKSDVQRICAIISEAKR